MSIDKVQSAWRPQEKEKAVRYLRAYAKKYSVQVPNFDVNKVQEVFGSRRDTMAAINSCSQISEAFFQYLTMKKINDA